MAVTLRRSAHLARAHDVREREGGAELRAHLQLARSEAVDPVDLTPREVVHQRSHVDGAVARNDDKSAGTDAVTRRLDGDNMDMGHGT